MAGAAKLSTGGPQGDVATAIAVLRQRFPDRVQTGEAIRHQHSHTLTWIASEPPDAVVWPHSTEEVAEIVRIAATHRVPIIPFGAGTSLEGHVNAPHGGISLDFQQMNAVLAVNQLDLDATVQAGVSRKQLNDHLRDLGLFFPVDPGAEEATIGGMAATRASGTTAVRYGTMRDNVLGLTAVMADGSIVRTSRRARKSSAGYDLTRLLVGSEGTLGVFTEVSVRLYGIPESIVAAVCPFETLEGAVNSVIQAIQLGLGHARSELLDEILIGAINKHAKLGLEERPTLFLEFHGTEVSARDQIARFEEIAKAEGAIRFDWAEREEDRRRLWKARHEGYWAIKSAYPGRDALATDVCVPISRLAECITETKADIEKTGLIASILGHVGDGNFHTQPMIDMSNPREVEATKGFVQRLTERAMRMDGTCTGEHGVGQGKIKYLEAEHGVGVEVMRRIKAALDPDGLLNPGKILPER
ncbi:MAG TPA: FAD-linked oxidase C-terminal domain-containing protein [Hyphomicrobiaceae bacterium]|nr:FAD-linked oxidase C-terminal domain-containing protein [Hyphomicrobiaceae bacterium]